MLSKLLPLLPKTYAYKYFGLWWWPAPKDSRPEP